MPSMLKRRHIGVICPFNLLSIICSVFLASCGDGQFRCNSGQCIPMAKECDKTPDCDDQSDEGDRCGKGFIIPVFFFFFFFFLPLVYLVGRHW